MNEGVAKVASGVVDGLKNQPLALSLVVINVLFLIAAMWFLNKVGHSTERRDQMLAQVMKDCTHKGD